MTGALIEAKGLHKSYGSFAALIDVGFELAESESLAIIGPNGAGKSTLFKVLTGESLANDGTLHYRGHDISQMSAHMRTRLGFGRTFQVARIMGESNVSENLVVAIEQRLAANGMSQGAWYAWRPLRSTLAEAAYWAEQVGLREKLSVEARNLSHGDRKRLELALVLALEPVVLMLDEPTAGMSPPDRNETIDLIQRLRTDRGLAVMLTEHDMDVVFGLSDRILVLNYGKVVTVGLPDDVRGDATVKEIYLGKEIDDA